MRRVPAPQPKGSFKSHLQAQEGACNLVWFIGVLVVGTQRNGGASSEIKLRSLVYKGTLKTKKKKGLLGQFPAIARSRTGCNPVDGVSHYHGAGHLDLRCHSPCLLVGEAGGRPC
jgi:hypothetical protein